MATPAAAAVAAEMTKTKTKDTIIVRWCYTDTEGFGGSANVNWQHVGEIEMSSDSSDYARVRAAKQAAGLANVSCQRHDFGDSIVLYPYRTCTALYINLW